MIKFALFIVSFLSLFSPLLAQRITILDEKKQPLPYVNILVSNTYPEENKTTSATRVRNVISTDLNLSLIHI